MMTTPILNSCIPLPIEEKTLLEVISKTKDWAIMHGAAMRSKTNFDPDVLQHAPFILTPSSFPRKEFEKAVKIQTLLNELIHWVANDDKFLREVLSSTIKVDDFAYRLFDIYEKVHKEGITQPLQLGLLRSDIMLETICVDKKSLKCSRFYCCWKQVEINTIASGFGHLGPASKDLQSFTLQELGHSDKIKNLPENNALSGLCQAMLDAWKLRNIKNSIILFIIEDITYNICDQRFHEFEITRLNPNVKVVRKTLTEIYEEGKLNEDLELIVNGNIVSVIYFRSGYSPEQYHSDKEWDARLLMERSKAIKCPSINYQLAGTKKIQQALAKPGVLKRFIKDDKQINDIKEIFTGLYSLDRDENGDEAVEMALKNPERYVLKPQREGGGNNIYGTDIPKALQEMSYEERCAWILMERIFPPISRGYMIRPHESLPPKISDFVSELGIFGAIIGDKDKIYVNRQVGHMLRTKSASANEGGVAAGSGALDSPYLID